MFNDKPLNWTLLMIFGGFMVIFGVPVVEGVAKYFLAAFILFLIWVCFASVISIPNSYNEKADTLKGLALIYIDTILLFAAAYFFLSVLDVEEKLIKGISTVCIKAECDTDNFDRLEAALTAFTESMYLSIVQTTGIDDSKFDLIGGPAKLIGAFHGLAVFFITVLGVPKYFSSTTEKKIDQAIAELKDNKVTNGRSKKGDSFFKRFVKLFA